MDATPRPSDVVDMDKGKRPSRGPNPIPYLNLFRYRRGNKNTAHDSADFVHNAVADLVKGGFVEEATEQPFICSPVAVVENSAGKKRLVVNLRHIN